jgi:hypothetical protein
MNGAVSLSDELLRALVDELAGKQTVAIILAGSHAHGDATPYRDVDMAHLVAAPLSGPDKQYNFREGHLVSVATRPLAWFRAAVTRPEHAVLCVAGLRQARNLLDREGTFRAFQQELENFSWVPLQEAANSYASSAMMHLAEFAHKVLSTLVRGDRLSLFEATSSLWYALTQAVAVQCGACRQVLSEFAAGGDMDVVMVTTSGTRKTRRLAALLPESFSSFERAQ